MILERDFPPDLRVENEISALLEKGIEVHVACYTFSKKDSVETYNGYTIQECSVFVSVRLSAMKGALKGKKVAVVWSYYVQSCYLHY